MAETKRATEYTWNGVWDDGAAGWQEWFGDPPEYGGLPPRNLTAADTAGFNDEQWKSLLSPGGQRLYTPKGGTPTATTTPPPTTTTSTTPAPGT